MSYPNFEKMVEVIAKLRDPDGGCPWDLKQTHQSLLRFLIEEAYEFIHATEENDYQAMEEEIGDVLLQVVLHCVIADQNGKFNLESVSKILADKMIRRHPHVFVDSSLAKDDSQVKENWEKIKKLENKEKKGDYFDESYLHFPALFSANKIGKKTNKINFDWEDAGQVMYKVEEEWQELKEELTSPQKDFSRIKEEMGDFLFSTAQLARHLDIDPEDALRQANKKFIRRFNSMEKLITEDSKSVEDMNQMEMDEYWDLAKRKEKGLS
ncbi:putative pyrophosphohydrolase [Halobacteriovorax marinus SJ]|uniref:Pyrophosphohydrolase n=1 Tax=Halobacteriovorax marinus (strain ATCC BAA-682 / DSM 15412 / SJ) TaxID=862908 RepID=E1X510_HALMS|nr:nucleoside triphosphate pyrophosphohydrolase [Halobacteriovorax marinus]CBW25481.1 putative pyrophosphohydrolase [Halobacteriovorax marinus SJ]